MDPRATPAARFCLGAAFFRAARFAAFRSVLSSICFVFMIVFSSLRISQLISSVRAQES
jgi:hypothetical protein